MYEHLLGCFENWSAGSGGQADLKAGQAVLTAGQADVKTGQAALDAGQRVLARLIRGECGEHLCIYRHSTFLSHETNHQ